MWALRSGTCWPTHPGWRPTSGRLIAPPATRRIYSNAGFEVAGELLTTASGIEVAAYLDEAVLAPLGMQRTSLEGSPASGAASTATDLARFATELLAPTLIAAATLESATSVQFPGLDGVLPGFGRQSPNDWGLGFELRDGKHPHWTAPTGSPRTFGHFGRSGTFLWIDPDARQWRASTWATPTSARGRVGVAGLQCCGSGIGRGADRLAVAQHDVLAVGIVLDAFARGTWSAHRGTVGCELHDVGLPHGIARVRTGEVRRQRREHDDVAGASGHRAPRRPDRCRHSQP